MKLFRSAKTQTQALDSLVSMMDHFVWIYALSKVISWGCFSKKWNVLCVASTGSKLVIILYFEKNFSSKVWSYECLDLVFHRWLSVCVFFLFGSPTCFLTHVWERMEDKLLWKLNEKLRKLWLKMSENWLKINFMCRVLCRKLLVIELIIFMWFYVLKSAWLESSNLLMESFCSIDRENLDKSAKILLFWW